jgi:hypothetical protein
MKDQFSKFAHNTPDMFKNTQSTTNSESYNLVLKSYLNHLNTSLNDLNGDFMLNDAQLIKQEGFTSKFAKWEKSNEKTPITHQLPQPKRVYTHYY